MMQVKQNSVTNRVFGLDIGTRSVVGIVGYKDKRGNFVIEAMCVKEHKTRAMLDGQIHDIESVSLTIKEVKETLEETLDVTLERVCIAAAGRVLKTYTVKAVKEFEQEMIVTDEDVYSLDMIGIENAYQTLGNDINTKDIRFYCVGYSTIKYYLNGYQINKLTGHRATKIESLLLATFLPEEVIEGLYMAVEQAGLSVANLTLEPIAAINVAIPEKFRLLNIALVDVGAGTSDICITSDGSVTAYGMISLAGDEITEAIAHKYLVEFDVAEKIKLACMKKKQVTFTDIMGIKYKLPTEDILNDVKEEFEKIPKSIAGKIKELNGGKSVSAVFVVGGGGKFPGFVECIANELDILPARVAIRGEEVLKEVIMLCENVKKDSLYVTPIGICLNYYESKNNFLKVTANDMQLKLFDNNNLTIVDVAVSLGINNDELFPRRGKDVKCMLNGKEKVFRGRLGENSEVYLNGQPVGIGTAIKDEDNIRIVRATKGEDAAPILSDIYEYAKENEYIVNDVVYKVPSVTTVNDKYESGNCKIQDDDNIVVINSFPLGELLDIIGLVDVYKVTRDGKELEMDAIISPKDVLIVEFNKDIIEESVEDIQESDEQIAEAGLESLAVEGETNDSVSVQVAKENQPEKVVSGIIVNVNSQPVRLLGKQKFIFVDILDFYEFDTSVARGTELILKVNGIAADFYTPLKEGDDVQIYWKE